MKFHLRYNIENEQIDGTMLAVPEWHFNEEYHRDEKDPEKIWIQFYGRGFVHGNIAVKHGKIVDKELWIFDGISKSYLLAKGKEITLSRDWTKKVNYFIPQGQDIT